MKNKIILFLFIIFLSTAQFSFAADQPVNDPVYAETSLENLAKSYWLLNKLDTKDDRLMDQYLQIAECDLFKKYYSNDIEWNKVRAATRDYIEKYKNSFPKHFVFVQPIYLDRFDFEAGGFKLLPSSVLSSVNKMYISGNQAINYPCLESGNFDKTAFPLNAVLNIEKPFNYSIVKTDQNIAQAYLEHLEAAKVDLRFGRPAYIRYKINVGQSLGVTNIGNEPVANFFGDIENVEIFGDKSLSLKLDETSF